MSKKKELENSVEYLLQVAKILALALDDVCKLEGYGCVVCCSAGCDGRHTPDCIVKRAKEGTLLTYDPEHKEFP